MVVGAVSGRAALIPSSALLVGDSGVLGVAVPDPRALALGDGPQVLAAMARGESQPKTVLVPNGHDH